MKNKSAKKPAALAIVPIDRSTLSPAESRMIAAVRRLDFDVLDFYLEVLEDKVRNLPTKTAGNRPALKLVKVGHD